MNSSYIAVFNPIAPPSAVWHQEFLTEVLPTVEACAQLQFRRLPPVERDDALSESIAVAMLSYLRLLKRGRNPIAFAGRLAKLAVLRVKSGRIAGSSDRSEDALSRLARQQRGFSVESLDTGRVQTRNGWEGLLVEDRRSSPADIAASRIDFAEWLGRMKHHRRKVAETLAAGFRTEEAALIFNISRGRISQMRREFELSWKEFQREAPQRSAEKCSAAA